MGAHILEMVLTLVAFGAVVVGASFVFAMTAERDPERTSRRRVPSGRRVSSGR
jgi:NADH:ubiquinone oxidoreductase subunit 6 (subunit J)